LAYGFTEYLQDRGAGMQFDAAVDPGKLRVVNTA
jgi:hypothetical protein